jgi:pyruvate dehydrogenase E1 component beta subunit
MAEAFNEALADALSTDPHVILLGEDIGTPSGGIYKVTRGLEEAFGAHRVPTTPIAEEAIVGMAVGLALAGFRPVAELMLMDYLTFAVDQLVNHAAKLRYATRGTSQVPLTLRAHVGGGFQGGPQHSQSLEAWLAHIPGLKTVMPSTPADAKGLLTACIEDPDPCVCLESLELIWKGEPGPVPEKHYVVPLGLAARRRKGKDVSILSWGRAMPECMKAAERLAEDGVDADVLDLRSLVPLDRHTILESVSRTRRAVIVHASTRFCGVGAEIASLLHEELFGDLLAPVARVAFPFVPTPYAANLELTLFPSSDRIVASVNRSLESKPRFSAQPALGGFP